MPIIKAVIFDLDGTLIDSNWLHLRSWQTALRNLGMSVTDQEIIDRLGLKTFDIARRIVSSHDEETVWRLVQLKSKLFEKAWRREVNPREGALEILRMIKDTGLRSAVASSNTAERITGVIGHFGMDKLIDAVVGIDEVRAGKPDPALVTIAISKLGASPAESIYVGDSRYDMEAGRAAGARTALVIQEIAAQSNLKVQPDYRVRELSELRQIIWPDIRRRE